MRGFLTLLAQRGAGPVAVGDFAAAVSAPARQALRDEGIVRPGPLARTHACGADAPGCAREVRGFDDDDDLGVDDEDARARMKRDRTLARTYVAVCTQSPHACPFVELTSDDLAQVVFAMPLLARALTRLFSLAPPARGAHTTAPARDDEPLLLGQETRDGDARDVFLLLHPRSDLEHRLGARERDARAATYLVPTAQGIDPALFARHGQSARVQLARLEDRIAVRDGALVATPRLRVVAAGRGPARPPRRAPVAPANPDVKPLPPIERWSDLRVCMVDGETVLLTAYGVSSRRTHADMGMAAKNNRRPNQAWRVLIAICEGEGRFVWKDLGSYEAAEKGVSRLRIALKERLGLEEDPFEVLEDGQGWRPRFVAKKEPPRDRMPGKR